jgi:hypothetical protein
MVVLDSLNRGFGLTKKERIFYEQAAAIRYLIANGFQLLADGRLTTDEWKKLRMFSKEKIDIISERALSDFRLRMENKEELLKNRHVDQRHGVSDRNSNQAHKSDSD